MEIIGNDTFSGLQGLIELDLSDNHILILHEYFFRYNLKLTKLLLFGNRLLAIHPRTFHWPKNIQIIDLRGNPCIKGSFEITDGDLSVIRSRLGECFRRYFDNNNYCHYGETEIGYTCTYINAEIYQEEFLSTFYVFGDHENGKMDLDVVRVAFESSICEVIVSDIFSTFRNLKQVVANNVGLKILIKISNCQRLEKFTASNNQIEVLEVHHFSECVNLRSVDLSSNRIKKLKANLFGRNFNLENINLSSNLIESIQPCESFQYLENLKSIDFTGNKCINQVLLFEFDKGNLADIKKKLSVCHSYWILNEITAKIEL
jgi:Leucine-rich repeat (LRR) protein